MPHHCEEALTLSFNLDGCAQKVTFDGISQPDIDPEDTESEWKLFRRVVFVAGFVRIARHY